MLVTSRNEKDDMSSFISIIARFLVVSILVSLGCFSCILPVIPVHAATSASIDTPSPRALVTNNAPPTDRGMRMDHARDCTPVYDQAISSPKRFSLTDFSFTSRESMYSPQRAPLTRPLSFSPPPVLLTQRILLTGTTIKKE